MSRVGRNDPCPYGSGKKIALMSEQVFDWWLFFDYEHEPGRYVVDTPGDPVLDGGVLPIPMIRAESLIEWLRSTFESAASDPAEDESDKEICATVVSDIHRAWIGPMELPTLVNYDGDPLILSRAYFDIAELEPTVAALDAARELARVEPEGVPPRWDWSGEGRDRKERSRSRARSWPAIWRPDAQANGAGRGALLATRACRAVLPARPTVVAPQATPV